jgi:hypothetical protein
MSQAAIVINVSDQEHSHANGLSGIWTVPGRKGKEKFGILVIMPTPEIQDIGDQRKTVRWLKAQPIARDIMGTASDATAHTFGSKAGLEKWGLLLCEAQPDVPKPLLQALEDELEFLNDNPPDVKMRRDKKSGAVVAVNIEPPEIRDRKIKLSESIQLLRMEFEDACRAMVATKEILLATRNLQSEDQRLTGEADMMWERPNERVNISQLHQRACKRLGQERPWAYTPRQLVACPGCGGMIAENVITCSLCNGFLDEGIPELAKMSPRDRAMSMYPERYAPPEAGPSAAAGR